MGCTASTHVVGEGLNAPEPNPEPIPEPIPESIPVHDIHPAETKVEPSSDGDGLCKLEKDQDGQVGDSSSEMPAKISAWSKVNSFFTKHKSSSKSKDDNSKKSSSNDNLQEEEANRVGNRKSFCFHAVNMKDVEQLAEGKAEPRVSIWQRVTRGVKVADESLCLLGKTPSKNENSKWRCSGAPPGGEDRVVLYFTSLRGIRKTFDDCSTVKLILWGFNVLVDERDISMDFSFRQELQDLLGKPITVPRLFIAGECIGGIDEVLQLHEAGELAKYLEGFPRHTCSTRPCNGCDDSRFVPCLNCNGSHKIFTQKLGGQGQGRVVWTRCPCCNENGLIRCPVCCSDAAFVKT